MSESHDEVMKTANEFVERNKDVLKQLSDIGNSSWNSYPKVWHLGHRAVRNLFDGPVVIQEKIDGSQFSFGEFMDPETGETYLRCRSKGAEINVMAPEGMFIKAVEMAMSRKGGLHLGWTYRGEYLNKPKHNALAYDRTPKDNVILFDINTGEESYLTPAQVAIEAYRIGLEVVPTFFYDQAPDMTVIRGLLSKTSILGGQCIEGVVVKNYNLFGQDKKVLMGKFVSESYKEVHAGEWRENNPTTKDIIRQIVDKYRTPARWAKAVQHLREAGQLEDSPRDIGKLIPEVPKDILEEEAEEIKNLLMKHAWPHIRRGLTAGLPQWYKEELLKQQFEKGESPDETL